MKETARILALSILISSMLVVGGCSRSSRTVRVVKPKKHFGWFNGKKDRQKKRTKIVKYKVH